MSNVTIHLVIPVLLLIATRLFPTKQVLMWAPFALVPDLDTAINLFSGYFMEETIFAHRALLHNVFVFLPTLFIAGYLWRRMLQNNPGLKGRTWYEKWLAFGSVRWGYACVLITFYLFSHVLLDTFQGGTTILWPLFNTYVYPQLFIYVDMATGIPTAEAAVSTGPGAPALSSRFPWMTPEQVAIWILVAITALVSVWRESLANKSGEAAVDPLAHAGQASGDEGVPVKMRPAGVLEDADEGAPGATQDRPRRE